MPKGTPSKKPAATFFVLDADKYLSTHMKPNTLVASGSTAAYTLKKAKQLNERKAKN